MASLNSTLIYTAFNLFKLKKYGENTRVLIYDNILFSLFSEGMSNV